MGREDRAVWNLGVVPVRIDDQRRLADELLDGFEGSNSIQVFLGYLAAYLELHHSVVSQKKLQGAVAVVPGYPGVSP